MLSFLDWVRFSHIACTAISLLWISVSVPCSSVCSELAYTHVCSGSQTIPLIKQTLISFFIWQYHQTILCGDTGRHWKKAVMHHWLPCCCAVCCIWIWSIV